MLTATHTIYLTAQVQKWDGIIWLPSVFPIHFLSSSGFCYTHRSSALIISNELNNCLRQPSQRSLSMLLDSRRHFYSAFWSKFRITRQYQERPKLQKLQKNTENISAKDKLHQWVQSTNWTRKKSQTYVFLFKKRGLLRNVSLST